jgi:hypothetical protein
MKISWTKYYPYSHSSTFPIKIKAKAKRKNIPYQTLLGALLHDFAEGKRELTV